MSFNAPSGETVFHPEILAIPQAQIDEAIALYIYRMECLLEGKEDSSKLNALCDRALAKYIQDRFGIDPSSIRNRSGVYVVAVSPMREARLSIEEVYPTLDQKEQAARLTISFSVTIDGSQKSTYESIGLDASPQCVQSILKKLHQRDAERERQDRERQALLERLLPRAIGFARQHPSEELNAQACEPIGEFIEAFLGGELKPDETLRMTARDGAQSTWEFIRCRGEEVQDICQFTEKLCVE